MSLFARDLGSIRKKICYFSRLKDSFTIMFARIAGKKGLVGIAVGALGAGVAYGAWRGRQNGGQLLSSPPVGVVLAKSGHSTPHTRRQARFEKFASCEFDGQHLMTPADFLESLMHQELPGWSRKRQLKPKDIENMVYRTPALSKGSKTFFRALQDKGIITYSEYLFLVTILTKSKRGLEIGYRMLDKDGNQQLSKEEFLVLEEMVNKKSTAKSMEAQSNEKNGSSNTISAVIPGNTSTLLVHFFTPRGNGQLTFDQFSKFMVDLQVEVSEMEFMEYSRGMPTIPEESFAHLLLRNTALETEQTQQYIERLNNRLNVRKGIALSQYVDFCLFLNNLDDFAMAMRIYSIAGQPVTQDEFQRAVRISTGHTIDPYVVHTIFQLFDIDGDGKLGYHEFIELMKNRQKRGFRTPEADKVGWEGFKSCVKKELSL